MSTPKGMKCTHRRLANGDRIHLYSDLEQIVLQLRHQTPTEEDILDASFKVAVSLSPEDALVLASDLLVSAVPHLTRQATASSLPDPELPSQEEEKSDFKARPPVTEDLIMDC
ncbi:hypothetical protein KSD_72290 [Ktedonobacter sp. SOSP1-85]|uniref:hypothetical protein n=1 Tax=Ktedonobacter sp. SOSP1-85 TaxID=2778367 RepID=UPI0019160463|nr:hypothetical protein [Ktedonobacter sp. SOSP1-85]GHO79458.1 hypothetical protein KSD_72290 [Ktedonobacter sp. SOSP1-85]